jgi:hypothetical protein
MSYNVQRRMRDIYQQKADMGGCGPYGGMMDMDLYDGMIGDGVLIGGGPAGVAAAARSRWIKHVKKYAAAKGITYKEAMSRASPSYHKMKGKTVKRSPAKKSPRKVQPARLRALGLTQRQFNNLDLNSYQKGRIGRSYTRRTKKLKSCVKANRNGKFRLNKNYKCVVRNSKKKKT